MIGTQIKEGKGIELKFKTGDLYEGWFKQGKYHGTSINDSHPSGRFIWGDDGSCYEGSWKDGERHGFGTMYFASGDKFEGMFTNGKQESHNGKLFDKKGNPYGGEWVIENNSSKVKLQIPTEIKVFNYYNGKLGKPSKWLGF